MQHCHIISNSKPKGQIEKLYCVSLSGTIHYHNGSIAWQLETQMFALNMFQVSYKAVGLKLCIAGTSCCM